MSTQAQPMLTIEQLAQAYKEIQNQLSNAQSQFTALKTELNQTKQALHNAQVKLTAQDTASNNAAQAGLQPKKNKPDNYTGDKKESVLSWTTHMSNYLEKVEEPQAKSIAVSYLSGTAHEWWIKYKETKDGQKITTWAQLREALVSRFSTLNKEKIARDRLAVWKQLKDVRSFNEDFQKIILDIPNITIDEQIDRYTRGLKNYIWKEICTNDYESLSDAMCDAERIESAHRRVPTSSKKSLKNNSTGSQGDINPVPMELGNVQLRKLTSEEREKCMKEGLCLRCRQKGHMAKDCPKGKRN